MNWNLVPRGVTLPATIFLTHAKDRHGLGRLIRNRAPGRHISVIMAWSSSETYARKYLAHLCLDTRVVCGRGVGPTPEEWGNTISVDADARILAYGSHEGHISLFMVKNLDTCLALWEALGEEGLKALLKDADTWQIYGEDNGFAYMSRTELRVRYTRN